MGPVFIRVRFGVGSSPLAEPKRYERKSKRFQQKSENLSARRAERKVKKKEKKNNYKSVDLLKKSFGFELAGFVERASYETIDLTYFYAVHCV